MPDDTGAPLPGEGATWADVLDGRASWWLGLGDCRDVLATMPPGCVDAVVTDPPYPEISRDYGRMTEADWHAMMRQVVGETRHALTATGSAMFVLQANSERVGRMRPWLWEFMAWTAREWNQIQDVWWWNHTAQVTMHASQRGLMRPSVKACVWLGPEDAYRNQNAILWTESDDNKAQRASGRLNNNLHKYPSGGTNRKLRQVMSAARRGGVTPFNLWPIANANSTSSGGAYGHGAATPFLLCRRWVEYISSDGAIVLDPFAGSGTVGQAALLLSRRFIGCEIFPTYHAVARRRLGAAYAARQPALFTLDDGAA